MRFMKKAPPRIYPGYDESLSAFEPYNVSMKEHGAFRNYNYKGLQSIPINFSFHKIHSQGKAFTHLLISVLNQGANLKRFIK